VKGRSFPPPSVDNQLPLPEKGVYPSYTLIHQRDDDERMLASHLYAGDPGSSDGNGHSPRITFPGCRTAGTSRRMVTTRSISSTSSTAGCAMCTSTVHIHNADSGMFINGRFCTIQNVPLAAGRETDSGNHTGHHGIGLQNDDNLVTGIDLQTRFIHDGTVSGVAGNVISRSRGDRPLSLPPMGWGPAPINFVGLQGLESADNDAGWHVEPIDPAILDPADTHQAQLHRRLNRGPRAP